MGKDSTEFKSQVANKRSVSQLKNIYRNECTTIRTQLAEEHRQRRTTGAGKFVNGMLDGNPLLSFVQDSVTPMQNIDSTDEYTYTVSLIIKITFNIYSNCNYIRSILMSMNQQSPPVMSHLQVQRYRFWYQ